MKSSTFSRYLAALLLGISYLCLRPAVSQAQTYNMPTTGTSTITTCAGTLYDDGGVSGYYSPNDDATITIYPATAGNKVRLIFTSFATESGYDYLSIYDGTSTSAPLLGSYTGSSSPGTVYGTTSSGALTLRFTSDYVVQYDGFAATISCVTSVPQPDLTVQGATINPTNVVAGGTVAANSQVYNLSGGTASSSDLGYYLSTDNVFSPTTDTFLSYSSGGALAAGQSSTRYANLTVPAGTTPGTYYILFAADYLNTVAESNESNNVTAVGITVQAASPDLVIQTPTLSATSIQAGSALTFNCYIYNQGNSVASSSSVGFYISADNVFDSGDTQLTAAYGSALGAGYSSQRTGTAIIPSNTAVGTYYILFVADYQNQVAETNENNNVSAVSFAVVPPGPDLTVTQQSVYSSYIAAGGTAPAYAYIYNVGNQAASSSNLGYYLSTNTTFDASDVALGSSTGGTLAAGASSYRSATITVPAGTTAGNYYVLFVADPANLVTESNENNNVAYSSLTVYAPTIDLTISSPYLSPSQTSPGGTVSTSGYEYNQGNANAGAHRIGYYLSTNTTFDNSDILVGSTAISQVYAGYSTSFNGTLTVPAATATGNYYVLFVADDQNQIVETNENNNVAYQYLTVVAPGIDLTISNAYTSTSQTSANSTLSVNCYLNNLGTTTATGAVAGYYLSTNTTFDASDALLGSSPAITVAANGSVYRSATVTIPAGTTAGGYYVLFVADPANTIAETNENNNVVYQYLTVVAPTIDLYMYSGNLSSSSTTAGNTINATGYIYNQGNSVASPVTMGLYLSTNAVLDSNDILIGNTSISSLAGGAYSYLYSTATIPANTSAGSYYVLFVADYQNQLVETNKNNNVLYQYLQVLAAGPDLVMQSPAVSNYTIAAASTVVATSYIYNQGNSVASSSNAGFYLSTNNIFDSGDIQLATTTGGALYAQQSSYLSANLTIPANTTAGNYYILYVADPANLVAETNEINNVNYVSIIVTAPFTGTIVPYSGSTSITTCSAAIYDNGGNGPYSNNSSGSLTINPATANGLIRLSFSAFGMETNFDYLTVYDGASTSAPVLATYTGYSLPPTITASNTNLSGALTLRFVSDGSVTDIGFVANASCVQRLATLPQQTAGYDVSVLPNPVAGGNALRVQLSGAGQPGAATLTLHNSLGQLVATRTLTLASGRLNETELSTTGLATGVYVLRVSGTNLNVVRRVVVE